MKAIVTSAFCAILLAATTALAADAPQVTANNYVRAETDFQMRDYIAKMDWV